MSVPTPDRPAERYVHEAVYYDTAQQLVEATAPLLREALAEGADVALVCADENNRALSAALGGVDRVAVLPRSEVYTKAVTAVAYFRDFIDERRSAGASRFCVLGEVDFGTGRRAMDEWRRYEALLNHVAVEVPVWSLCAYDTRALRDPVLTTGVMTHPYLRRDGVQAVNPRRVDPGEVLRLADAGRRLIPDGEPTSTITDLRDLRELHRHVEALAGFGIRPEVVEDLLIGVHELAINGLRHGAPPVTVRFWVSRGRVECTVTDRGAGFEDPFVGYVRGGGDELPEGSFGLWLARQLCDEVVMGRTSEGFTTRLVVDL